MATGLKVGDTLDKYQIVQQIGAGGMSVVWKAYDKLIDRHVAIKQIMPEVADEDLDELHERFRREADTQKRVSRDGKHVAQIIDLIDESRGMFIVMEFIDGPTLEQLLASDGAPMDPRRAMGIIGAITIALQSIHEHGVVHRDLKPSNIMLPRDGGLKVADFGLATVVDNAEAMSIGSVRYMAPELFHGDDVDGRADIYSLGMMAYELLAGRRQFDEAFKIVLRDQRNQSLRWMKWHTNPRAKVQPLSKANPDIPETLSDLVARMMEKDPAQRIASAEQLLEAMRRHFAGAAPTPEAQAQTQAADVAAVDTVAPTAAVPTRSRWPLVLGMLLLAQLLIAGGIGMYRMQQRRAAAEADVADAKQTYREAEQAYEEGQFHRASQMFESLAREQDNMIGRRATSFALLSLARVDMNEGRYADARDAFYRVQEDDLLPPHRESVQRLIDEANKRISFNQEVAKIHKAIEDNRIGEARQLLAAQSTYSHTEEEDAVLIELEARLGGQLTEKRVDGEIAEARELEKQGKRDDAITALQRAAQKYSSPRIEDVLKQMRRDKAYDEAIDAADRAEREGNLEPAIAALTTAASIRGGDELASRIRNLKGRNFYDQARAAESAGDTARAQSLYTQAAGYGHNVAQQAIDRMKTSAQRDAYVRAGDSAMAASEFDAAITQYENALRLGADPGVHDRLTNAKVRLEVRKGQQLLDQGDIDGARAAFARARDLAPANTAAAQGLADITIRTQYMEHLASGDELRGQGKFADAKSHYRKARDLMNTEQVQQRLDDAEFDHLLAMVRYNIKKEEWDTAAGWLKTAAKIRDSEEMRKLYAEVSRHVVMNEDGG